MADHWRKQLRAAIKAKLTTPALASVTAANVVTDDEYPDAAGRFPGIHIVIGASQRRRVGTVNLGGGVQGIEVENACVVKAVILVRQDTGAADMCDQVSKEIEARWLATPVDRGLGMQGCRDAELISIEEPVFDTDSDVLTAQQTVQFEVTVRSFEGRPDQT